MWHWPLRPESVDITESSSDVCYDHLCDLSDLESLCNAKSPALNTLSLCSP